MERKFNVSDIEAAVGRAFETYKSDHAGSVCPVCGADTAGKFAITVALADGTIVHKGDTTVAAPLGKLAHIPVHIQLLEQMSVDELVKKSGRGSLEHGRAENKCGCGDVDPDTKARVHAHLDKHGIRAVSAVEPTGDREGKMDIITGVINSVMGSEPVLDDRMYKAKKELAAEVGLVDRLASRGFYLYDDASLSIDIYARLTSLTATTDQVARMGATVAAGGYNAATGQHVFNSEISPSIVALMATDNHRHVNTPWLMLAGVPAIFTRGGFVLAVIPGVMAIAALAPELNDAGISEKASKAVEQIARELKLSIFQ